MVVDGITLQGGTLTYAGAQSAATVGTVTLTGGASSGGANTITVTPATGTVGPATLTIADLVRSTAGTTVNFTGNNLGLGGTNNSQIILTQFNGGAMTLDDGILGGWATVNGTDFAGYIAPQRHSRRRRRARHQRAIIRRAAATERTTSGHRQATSTASPTFTPSGRRSGCDTLTVSGLHAQLLETRWRIQSHHHRRTGPTA